MPFHTKYKSLIAATIISGLGSFAAANAQDNAVSAPEATEAEAAGSFWDMPFLPKPFIDTTPEARDDGIPVGELGVDGGNKDSILRLARDINNSWFGGTDSLLIAQGGKLLFESYYKRGRVNLPHFQASATKAYTALAIGRAIQLGHLTMADLDKPIIHFLKGLDQTKLVEGVEKITLHKAMTMTSGLRFSEEQIAEYRANPDKYNGLAQVQAFLEHSAPITAESQSFLYQSPDPIMVMQVLDAALPGSAKDFIKKELLDKIGITHYRWPEDPSGLPNADERASMTSRDMIKWGTLVKNKGEWNGEQLIPEDFIAKATGKIVQPSEDETFFTGENVSNPGYGYFWWQADMEAGGKTYFTKSAQGGGGQYIILVEELDLIVVATAHNRDDKTMQMTAERILPAFTQ